MIAATCEWKSGNIVSYTGNAFTASALLSAYEDRRVISLSIVVSMK
jgi:hypothetical protein